MLPDDSMFDTRKFIYNLAHVESYQVSGWFTIIRKYPERWLLILDKSHFVYRLASKREHVFLSRSRRFGKSLLLSTLEYYFRGESHMFDGLEIAFLEKEWISYPVFRFDLSGESYTDPEKLLLHINYILDDIEDI